MVFAAYYYEHVGHSFVYTEFDIQEGAFVVSFPLSLVDKSKRIVLAKLITLFVGSHASSLFMSERSFKVYITYYVMHEFIYLG